MAQAARALLSPEQSRCLVYLARRLALYCRRRRRCLSTKRRPLGHDAPATSQPAIQSPAKQPAPAPVHRPPARPLARSLVFPPTCQVHQRAHSLNTCCRRCLGCCWRCSRCYYDWRSLVANLPATRALERSGDILQVSQHDSSLSFCASRAPARGKRGNDSTIKRRDQRRD